MFGLGDKDENNRQQDMVWLVVWTKRGDHYHCGLFSAPRPDHTYAKSGDLVVRESEWQSFKDLMQRAHFREWVG